MLNYERNDEPDPDERGAEENYTRSGPLVLPLALTFAHSAVFTQLLAQMRSADFCQLIRRQKQRYIIKLILIKYLNKLNVAMESEMPCITIV